MGYNSTMGVKNKRPLEKKGCRVLSFANPAYEKRSLFRICLLSPTVTYNSTMKITKNIRGVEKTNTWPVDHTKDHRY